MLECKLQQDPHSGDPTGYFQPALTARARSVHVCQLVCHSTLGHTLEECVESKAKHRVATATGEGRETDWAGWAGCHQRGSNAAHRVPRLSHSLLSLLNCLVQSPPLLISCLLVYTALEDIFSARSDLFLSPSAIMNTNLIVSNHLILLISQP